MNLQVSGQASGLPEDVVFEVLSRLPVKSLLKFRCVSKSWDSLISSKQFIHSHLDYSVNNPNSIHHSILAQDKHYSVNSLLYESSIDAVNIGYPREYVPETHTSVPPHVVGCCNGLVCLLINNRHLVLWNPSTGKAKKLPDIIVDRRVQWGFGFDKANQDYKVIASGTYSVMEIYSSNTNSWKSVHGFNQSEQCWYGPGKFLNGKVHWVLEDFSALTGGWNIIYFDVETEARGVVERPKRTQAAPSLGVLGGCLCLHYDDKFDTEVWVQKKYGPRESWDKFLKIPCTSLPRSTPLNYWTYPKPVPRCLFREPGGETLIVYGSWKFAVYDPKANSFRDKKMGEILSPLDAINVYIPSLVSPFLGKPSSWPDQGCHGGFTS